MANIKPKLLVIEDEDSMLRTYRSILKEDYNLILINNGQAAVETVGTDSFSVALLDMMMPGMNGIATLRKIKEIDKNIEVIMVTAVREIKIAVEAIKLGAYDYLTKPFETEELRAIIEKALEKRSLTKENIYLKQILAEKGEYLDLLGKTDAIKQVFRLIDKIAALDSTVLITGESGTGKELVANALHKKSPRAEKPFVVVNCAAITESLIESELFGHEPGSFTGALERKEGKFELADGGTVFLDEIGCMKPPSQTKLLRVLQDNVVERVGGKKPIQVDVRVIAATNLDLEAAVKRGEFREDLFYRLNVIRIQTPPLRDRKDDIPLLLNYFLEKYNKEFNKRVPGFSAEALAIFAQYRWPGNVRELQNIVERVVALSENDEKITPADLPLENAARNTVRKPLKDAVAEFEKNCLQTALDASGGNQTKAAEALGIHRTTLISKMELLDLK